MALIYDRIAPKFIIKIIALSIIFASPSLMMGNTRLVPEQAQVKLLKTRLDAKFSVQKDNEPGGSVMILKDNKVLYSRSFGLSDLGTKTKFTSETVNNLGSISKTFVAYGILILNKQGKLTLDDPISKYFPDFKNREIAEKVKIRHLLTHTSGLPDSRNVDGDSVFYLSAKDEENFAPLKLTEKLEFEPGSQWKYSNPAYNGLALIIEKVSGMKWQWFVEEKIFRPAGMGHSKITDGPYPESGVAHGYRKINNQWKEFDYGEYPTMAAAGNGGVWSSIDELCKYVKAVKNCSFLDYETIKFSETTWNPDNWNSPEPPGQGFCWFIHKPDDSDKNYRIEHSGSQAGFRAHLIMYPDAGIVVIWLSNNEQTYTKLIIEQLTQAGYLK
jgi:CubicO group peptidase (beta-lactamase class C family)